MTDNINDDARARREAARNKGRFGEQQHSAPEQTLSTGRRERYSTEPGLAFAVAYVSKVDGETRELGRYPESDRAEEEARVARKNAAARRAKYVIIDIDPAADAIREDELENHLRTASREAAARMLTDIAARYGDELWDQHLAASKVGPLTDDDRTRAAGTFLRGLAQEPQTVVKWVNSAYQTGKTGHGGVRTVNGQPEQVIPTNEMQAVFDGVFGEGHDLRMALEDRNTTGFTLRDVLADAHYRGFAARERA